MKILFIAVNFPPEVNAPANRIWAHCKRWVQLGEDVTVIASAPNFPAGQVFKGYRNRLYQRERIEGINLIRVWSFIAPNAGIFVRALDFLSFAISSFVAGLFQRPDIVVTSSPQLFVGIPARALAFIKHKPWIFEVRDLWPESIAAVGMIRKGFFYRILEGLELYFYRSASAVIIVSEGFRKSLTVRGIDPEKIFTIPNGADVSDFVPRARNRLLRDSLGLESQFLLGFFGTHGLAHGLDFILDCAPALAAENVHVLLAGDGERRAKLIERARNENLRNVHFVDPVQRKDVPALVAQCDGALVNLIASPTFLDVIPSKIFEAAALQCPILLGVDGITRQIVESFGAGIFYQPEDKNSFIAAALRLKTDRQLYFTLKEGCRALAKAYNRDQLADRALEVIRSCAVTTNSRTD